MELSQIGEAMTDKIEITQADRDAVKAFAKEPHEAGWLNALNEAFARHRQASTAPLKAELAEVRKEIERLREALEPFAMVCDAYDYWVPEVMPDMRYPVAGTELVNAMIDCPTAIGKLTENDFRRARAALNGKEG